ncbi:MAG TPA: hypothetical protein VF731_04765 [Solirubrobacterales bacterium]
MTNRRAKIAAGATVVGLAALGGAALGSNHGLTPVTQAGSGATASVVTGASGAATAPTAQTAALHQNAGKPIVTRASGGGALAVHDD